MTSFASLGAVPEWLGSGLQNRLHRFNSGRHLQINYLFIMTIYTATAHTNIALIKYWGKSSDTMNIPAVSSLSLTLEPFYTVTSVKEIDAADDQVSLNGIDARPHVSQRVTKHIDLFRELTGATQKLLVQSTNHVPTSAGLASSASGFAALTLALAHAFNLNVDAKGLSRLARRGSGSAARSLFAGYSLLHGGANISNEEAFAEPVTASPDLDLLMIVAECAESEKAVASSEAMRLTAQSSVFYHNFLEHHPFLLGRALAALKNGDFSTLGSCMEQSTMQMHATMLGCEHPFWYFNQATISVLNEVRYLREKGNACYFTMDAGPHVKILCLAPDSDNIAKHIRSIEGVSRVTLCKPGPAAQLL